MAFGPVIVITAISVALLCDENTIAASLAAGYLTGYIVRYLFPN